MSEDIDGSVGACRCFIAELNQVGRLWDKNGTRLYPIVDRAVAAIALCQDATEPAVAQTVVDVCMSLIVWIEAHRAHLAKMTDLVQTMLTTAHIPVSHGHWAEACSKGETRADEGAVG